MRVSNCEQCGGRVAEDDSIPSIHYSNPAKICFHCEIYNKKKNGDYHQKSDGSYFQKADNIDSLGRIIEG